MQKELLAGRSWVSLPIWLGEGELSRQGEESTFYYLHACGLGAKLSPVSLPPTSSAPSMETNSTTRHWHTSYFHGAFAGNEAEGRARYTAQKILMRSSGRHRCNKIWRDQHHQELSENDGYERQWTVMWPESAREAKPHHTVCPPVPAPAPSGSRMSGNISYRFSRLPEMVEGWVLITALFLYPEYARSFLWAAVSHL